MKKKHIVYQKKNKRKKTKEIEEIKAVQKK